jgi:hypothetical protein
MHALRLIGMYPLGNGDYYVWIADTGITNLVIRKALRQVRGEWKMCIDPAP